MKSNSIRVYNNIDNTQYLYIIYSMYALYILCLSSGARVTYIIIFYVICARNMKLFYRVHIKEQANTADIYIIGIRSYTYVHGEPQKCIIYKQIYRRRSDKFWLVCDNNFILQVDGNPLRHLRSVVEIFTGAFHPTHLLLILLVASLSRTKPPPLTRSIHDIEWEGTSVLSCTRGAYYNNILYTYLCNTSNICMLCSNKKIYT